MKAASVKQIKDELKERTPAELMNLCLRLSKFKKENKELLTYLLFEAQDEAYFIRGLKEHIDDMFQEINRSKLYFIKKGIRKILREIKKYIRYTQNKETEVELLIYFCQSLQNFNPSVYRSTTLQNLYDRQVEMIRKRILLLHEDLQYDYGLELENL